MGPWGESNFEFFETNQAIAPDVLQGGICILNAFDLDCNIPSFFL